MCTFAVGEVVPIPNNAVFGGVELWRIVRKSIDPRVLEILSLLASLTSTPNTHCEMESPPNLMCGSFPPAADVKMSKWETPVLVVDPIWTVPGKPYTCPGVPEKVPGSTSIG
jgi:hypothetical protein